MSTLSKLQAAREAAATARAEHEENVAALVRGRERLAAAEAELKRCAADDEQAITRYAARLEKETREGTTAAPPALVPTAAQMAARVTAQRTHEAARRMVASLESAARKSAATLADAEEALQAAVLQAIGQEADGLAREVEQMRADLKVKEELLSAVREVPNFRPSGAVYRALRDELNMPLTDLGHGADWDAPVGDLRMHPTPIDATTHWHQRLAHLTNGDVEATSAESVAA